MEVAIRSIGNSRGVVLPKPLLMQVGLDQQSCVEVSVEMGAIVLRKPLRKNRQGWSDAAKLLADQGEDALLMGEFGNAADAELSW